MKRELFINISLGIISLGIIGFIIVKNNQPSPMRATSPQTTPSPAIQSNESTIPMNDFIRHNSANDCWIRINGNVYNVTNFLNEHPGGAPISSSHFAAGRMQQGHLRQREEEVRTRLVLINC